MSTPSPEAFASAHDALAPLLPILDAFNHRNKNQHRATHWYSSFAILRRTARALVHDLYQAANPKRPSKRGDASSSSSPAVARARWIADHLLPRCYLAFTQLAADNQHAPLGLLLLAILARINTILTALLPPDPSARAPSPLATQPQASATGHTQPATDAPSPSADRGVAISRRSEQGGPPVHTGRSVRPADDGPRPTRIKTEAAKREKDSTKKDKEKKKKRKKGGDELSSLFGSLA